MLESISAAIERYEVLGPLGDGSMGIVYRVRDREDGTERALKVLRSDAAVDRASFEDEIRALASLRHPGIVELCDVGFAAGHLYYAMELVEGRPLSAVTGDRPLTWWARIFSQIADALAHVHSRGLVHGDLKPANVLVVSDSDRDEPTARIVDFGLVRRAERASRERSGTALYMAPEAIEGRPATPRSDLYSLGAMAYHLLAGRPAHSSVASAARSRAKPLSDARPDVPARVERLVASLLERRPDRRPGDAAVVSAAWRDALDLPPARADRPRLLTPGFVGRRAETELLLAATADAVAGSGRSIHVFGPTGSGTSWLLHRSEWKAHAIAAHGCAWLRASFASGDGSLLGSSGELLRTALAVAANATREVSVPGAERLMALLGAPTDDRLLEPILALAPHAGPSPAVREAAIARHSDRLARPRRSAAGAAHLRPDPRRAANDLAGSASSESRSPRAGRRSSTQPDCDHRHETRETPGGEGAHPPELDRELLLDAAVRIVAAASERRPVVVVLEDLDEADEVAREFALRLERAAHGRRLLVVLAGAEPRRPPGDGDIALDVFSDADLERYLGDALWPRAAIDPELQSFVRERSGGRPGKVAPWLRHLWDVDALRRDETAWRLGDRTRVGPRADPGRELALSGDARRLLDDLTALDAPVDLRFLETLAPSRQWSRPAALVGELVEAGCLVESPDGYEPAGQVGDSATRTERSGVDASSPSRERRWLHIAVGRLFEERGDALRAAQHFERGGSRSDAARAYAAAARKAARSHAYDLGRRAWLGALACADDDEARSAAWTELGDLEMRTGHLDAALEAFDRAGRPLAPDDARHPDLWDRKGRALQRKRDLDGARAAFENGLAETLPPLVRANALRHLAGVALERGDLEEAEASYLRSLGLGGDAAPPRLRIAIHSGLGLVAKQRGDLVAAIGHFERALEDAERAGDLYLLATVVNNLGNLRRASGDIEGAIECLSRSIDSRERLGDRQGLAISVHNMARIERQRGHLGAARDSTSRALDIFREIGDEKGVLIAQCNLGEILTDLGAFERAATVLRLNLGLATALDAQRVLQITQLNLARLERETGDSEAAIERIARLLESAPPGQTPTLRVDALTLAAEAEMDLDRCDAARRRLAEAGSLGTASLALDVARIREARLSGRLDDALEIASDRLPGARSKPAGDSLPLDDALLACRLRREAGIVHRDLGPDWADRTEQYFESAIRGFEALESPHELAETLAEYAAYWRLIGERDAFAEHMERARGLLRDIGLGSRAGRGTSARGMETIS